VSLKMHKARVTTHRHKLMDLSQKAVNFVLASRDHIIIDGTQKKFTEMKRMLRNHN